MLMRKDAFPSRVIRNARQGQSYFLLKGRRRGLSFYPLRRIHVPQKVWYSPGPSPEGVVYSAETSRL